MTDGRVATLAAMSEEEMDTVGWSPVGEVPYRQFMRVRLFDCWMHEQDIRRAVGKPGHLEGPVDRQLDIARRTGPPAPKETLDGPRVTAVVDEMGECRRIG